MGRRRIPEEVKEYAKQLYLTLDENGNRAYSLQQIADKCNEKFNIGVTRSTIKRWADRYSWDVLLLQAAQVSVVKMAEEVEDREPDEKLLDSLVALKRRVFEKQYRISQTAMELLERKLEDPRAVRDSYSRLIEVATKANKTLMELLDAVEVEREAQVQPVIIINELPALSGDN